VDLATPDFLPAIESALDGREIGLLVSCAARSPIGRFLEQPLQQLDEVLQLNCRAPLVLSHELGRRMLGRGRGGLILVSSLSGRRGTPLVAHYAATKAYNQILGEGLWAELREHGIDVLSFAPGATATPGFERSRPQRNNLPGRMVMDCPTIVAEALDGLGRQPSLVPGRAHRLASLVLERLLPRRMAIRFLADNMRKLYPNR
jgi:short-subunit dehydrogenase